MQKAFEDDYGSRNVARCQHDFRTVNPMDDGHLKMALAIQSSIAIAASPGAFEDNQHHEFQQKKGSIELISNISNLKRAQKIRSYVDRERYRPENVSHHEAEVIDEFHVRMNAFREETDAQNAKEDAELVVRRHQARQQMICWATLVLLVIVCTLGGIVVGVITSTREGLSAKDASSTVQPAHVECYTRPLDEQSARFKLLLNDLSSQAPGLLDEVDSGSSTAKAALCWLADFDGFVIKADNQTLLQRLVLAMIYFNFVGTTLSTATQIHPLSKAGWLTDASYCDWRGVRCESTGNNESITALDLRDMQLQRSSIPTELGLLTNLTEVFLNNNELTGRIPIEISALTRLKTLHLFRNKLTGQIPPGVVDLTHLESLMLGSNGFSGTLPNNLANATSLTSLQISGPIMSGTIPDLGNLTKLKHISLQELWGLVGAFPNLSGSSNLDTITVGKLSLTGTIPSYIYSLGKLSALSLSSTEFSGTISTSFGNLTSLQLLDLEFSQLTGSIPTEIGHLSLLKTVRIATSQLTGIIPTEIGLLSHLEFFSIPCKVTGTIPSEVCDFPSISFIDVKCSKCKCCCDKGLMHETAFNWNNC